MQNRELKILNVILEYSGFMFEVLKGHDKPISTEAFSVFRAEFSVLKAFRPR